MKRSSYFLLFMTLISLWGCPTKKQIPAPKPPEPQTEVQHQGDQAQMAYDWLDVVEILKGAAPLVGPTPYFFRMLA